MRIAVTTLPIPAVLGPARASQDEYVYVPAKAGLRQGLERVAEAESSTAILDYYGRSALSQRVRDGALPSYLVLVFLWSNVVEADALDAIDRWVQQGGIVLFACWNRTPLGTVEGDFTVYNHWLGGETGAGRVIFYRGGREPPQRYAGSIRRELLAMRAVDARTSRMLGVKKPCGFYVSVLGSGTLAMLNYNDEACTRRDPRLAAPGHRALQHPVRAPSMITGCGSGSFVRIR